MTRAFALLIHNWPLKLAALTLASLLYSVLVVGQNTRTFPGSIPIVAVNQRADTILLSNLEDVTQVRYFTTDDTIRVDESSFEATVDLSGVDPKGGTVSVPVQVRAANPSIHVLDAKPGRVSVQLEQVVSRTVPIRVEEIQKPANLDIREPVLSLTDATVRGPASVVRRVDRVEARVQIDATGVDFDRDVELIPVDVVGNALTPVDVQPSTVRVKIAVFSDRQTRALPITPNVTGTPAPGFEIASVAVSPLVITVEGDADQLVALTRVDTAPISVNGASANVDASVELALPTGVLPLDATPIHVTITLRQVTSTRTFSAGIILVGASQDRTYTLSTDRILVTIGGSAADLDRLQGESFDVQADVTNLSAGLHHVTIRANLPAGLTLVAASPPAVGVTVGTPSPSASVSASAGASAAPSSAP